MCQTVGIAKRTVGIVYWTGNKKQFVLGYFSSVSFARRLRDHHHDYSTIVTAAWRTDEVLETTGKIKSLA